MLLPWKGRKLHLQERRGNDRKVQLRRTCVVCYTNDNAENGIDYPAARHEENWANNVSRVWADHDR